MGFALILQLTGVNGSRQFDKLTKTKTVESILTSMDADGIKRYIDYLLSQSNEEEGAGRFVIFDSTSFIAHCCMNRTEIQAINSRRMWIVDQLTALIRNGAIPKSDDWIQLVLDCLVVGGLFVVKRSSGKSRYRAVCLCFNIFGIDILTSTCFQLHSVPFPAFSDDLRQACRTRLLSCLAELTSQSSLIKSGASNHSRRNESSFKDKNYR